MKNLFVNLLQRYKKEVILEKDIIIFLRQFATLITAGISLLQSLDLLIEMQKKIQLSLLISNIKNEILSGKTLSTSLDKKYFSELICHLIRIGEETGQLDTILLMLALQQEKHWQFKNSIKQALFYPFIITIAALLVAISMFIFIIPHFADLFATTQIQLPLYTLILFYCATLVNRFIWLILIMIIILCIYLRYHKSNIIFFLQKILTRLPVIANYHYKMQLAQFARHLAMTYQAGVPIIDALALITEVEQSSFALQIKKLQRQVTSGKQLHQVMYQDDFPTLMVQLVKIGEESGTLEQMLYKTSEFFTMEIEQTLAYSLKLVEPLIMIILGVLIGGLVIGMYLPLFNLGNSL